MRANRLGSAGMQCQSYGKLRDAYLWIPTATDPCLRMFLGIFRGPRYSDKDFRTAESSVLRYVRVPKSWDTEFRNAGTNVSRWSRVPKCWDTDVRTASTLAFTMFPCPTILGHGIPEHINECFTRVPCPRILGHGIPVGLAANVYEGCRVPQFRYTNSGPEH